MDVVIRIPAFVPFDMPSALAGLGDLGDVRMSGGAGGERWLRLWVDNKPGPLNRALEVGTRINQSLMGAWARSGNYVPSVYELAALRGFRYKPEPPGREWWQTFLDNLDENEGDCEDLAMHQAAWHRHNGERARAFTKKTGKRIYHAVVERADGSTEDPSIPLGLGELRAARARLRALRGQAA